MPGSPSVSARRTSCATYLEFFLILGSGPRGNQARINGVMGTVEDVRLRTIVLRDGDGAVQGFRGSITSLNFSKQFVFATVDVRVLAVRTRRS